MANNRTLTAANAIVSITVPGLFPVPQIIDGFEIEDNFTSGAISIAETVLTLDGELEGGFVYSTVPLRLNLLPMSNSKKFFVDYLQATRTNQDIFRANFSVTMIGEKTQYTLTNGIYISGQVIPNVAKIQKAVPFEFLFSSKNVTAVSTL
jgi:hypothetical protein